MASVIEMLREKYYGEGPGEFSVEDAAGYFAEEGEEGLPEWDEGLPEEAPFEENLFEEEAEEETPESLAKSYSDKAIIEAQMTAAYQKKARK